MNMTIEKIKAAYESEVANHRPPGNRDDLPLNYEEITPKWLTDVLCDEVQGAEVISLSLGERDDGNSNRRRIFVEYNEKGKQSGLPERVFCKASHNLANRISLGPTGCIQGEILFYKKIRPVLDIEAPVAYFSKVNEDTLNSILILGDLGDEVTFCTHTTDITPERARSQLRLLAKYHGKFLDSDRLKEIPGNLFTWPEFFRFIDYPDYEQACDKGFIAAEEVIPSSLFARRKEIWPATRKSVERHRHLPETLSHGDTHLRNWYIGAESEVGLSDWQAITRSHWSRDLAYVLVTSLTIEDRRRLERELIDYYLDQLQQISGQVISAKGVFDNYRQQMMTVLTFWTVTMNPAPGMPDFQPRDSTIEMVRRIAAAIDDLDVLDSF